MLDLIKIRKELHSDPELSGVEVNTMKYLKKFLSDLKPDKILELCGSLVVFFKAKKKGKTIAFRADIDALPIQELNSFKYASKKPNIAHLCGHDGHTAILLGLAEKVSQNKPKEGSIILIFQSAEETGQGAKALMRSRKFLNLKIDEIYGFHNIPGYKLGTVLLKSGTFTSASTGMIIKLQGRSSHASEPEKGISPISAINNILTEVEKINSIKKYQSTSSFVTVVGIKAGDDSFGISPSDAEIYLTIRSQKNAYLEEITEKLKKAAKTNKMLKTSIEFKEEFPSIENNIEMYKSCIDSIEDHEYEYEILKRALPWSEDFGFYTETINGLFIGVGSGIDHPALHDQYYDFPNEIIDNVVNLLYITSIK